MSRPRQPSGLKSGGKRLWSGVVDEYELRSDEVRVREDACRTVDLVDDMQQALRDAPLLAAGSQGQADPNPLLTEIRGHRALLAALLRQLGLPDEEGRKSSASRRGQEAAAARWRPARGA